jgi:hypothetical protein
MNLFEVLMEGMKVGLMAVMAEGLMEVMAEGLMEGIAAGLMNGILTFVFVTAMVEHLTVVALVLHSHLLHFWVNCLKMVKTHLFVFVG